MAKTIQDILNEARVFIQDSDTPYRYSDDDLVDYLNNGLYEIRRIRPDYFINSYDTDVPQFTTAQLGSDYPLDGQTHTAIAYFIAGNAAIRDDEHVNEGRAAGLLNLFQAKLLTAGS